MRKGHVLEQWWVSDVGSVAIAHEVRGPVKLGRISVAGTDVFVLERFQLLGGSELVGLEGISILC